LFVLLYAARINNNNNTITITTTTITAVNAQVLGDALDMQVSVAKSVGWLAVGFGGGHGEVDSVHCSFGAGTTTALDTHAITGAQTQHNSDIANDVVLVDSQQTATLTYCRFTRLLS
jgi:uncharacterized spore protein YtfJ